jgi:glycosyltransferase involved in cell wall biosynthesis
MDQTQPNICIITPPFPFGGVTPLSNLLDILSSFSNSVIVITGITLFNPVKKPNTQIYSYKTQWLEKHKGFIKALNHIHIQLDISYHLIKYAKNADIWIFFLDSHVFLLPVLIARLLRKKTVFALTASISEQSKTDNNFLKKVAISQEPITLKLADFIILYSPLLIEKWNLQEYVHKILIAHDHFLSLTKFRVDINPHDRLPIIGYIGRLSPEKGVQNFVQALPAILNDKKEFRVLIGGDGRLKENIEATLKAEKLMDSVDLPGWVSNEDYPNYLNRLKLFILPSYSEGLPYSILEAMACETPVLATSVGAIPDVITDGKTGFLMKDNSPECIAENVIRALNSPDLEKIAKNGRLFVENTFTFDKTVENWKRILQMIE